MLWLSSFGERYVDEAAGRPGGPPRPPAEQRASVIAQIPDTTERMPETISFDPATRGLSSLPATPRHSRPPMTDAMQPTAPVVAWRLFRVHANGGAHVGGVGADGGRRWDLNWD